MKNNNPRLAKIKQHFSQLWAAPGRAITTFAVSTIPDSGGVYVISRKDSNHTQEVMYVGRSRRLRTRICKYHTRKTKGAFGRYLVRDGASPKRIGEQIRDRFAVRFILEEDYKTRGLLEAYATAILAPKYGIDEEH